MPPLLLDENAFNVCAYTLSANATLGIFFAGSTHRRPDLSVCGSLNAGGDGWLTLADIHGLQYLYSLEGSLDFLEHATLNEIALAAPLTEADANRVARRGAVGRESRNSILASLAREIATLQATALRFLHEEDLRPDPSVKMRMNDSKWAVEAHIFIPLYHELEREQRTICKLKIQKFKTTQRLRRSPGSHDNGGFGEIEKMKHVSYKYWLESIRKPPPRGEVHLRSTWSRACLYANCLSNPGGRSSCKEFAELFPGKRSNRMNSRGQIQFNRMRKLFGEHPFANRKQLLVAGGFAVLPGNGALVEVKSHRREDKGAGLLQLGARNSPLFTPGRAGEPFGVLPSSVLQQDSTKCWEIGGLQGHVRRINGADEDGVAVVFDGAGLPFEEVTLRWYWEKLEWPTRVRFMANKIVTLSTAREDEFLCAAQMGKPAYFHVCAVEDRELGSPMQPQGLAIQLLACLAEVFVGKVQAVSVKAISFCRGASMPPGSHRRVNGEAMLVLTDGRETGVAVLFATQNKRLVYIPAHRLSGSTSAEYSEEEDLLPFVSESALRAVQTAEPNWHHKMLPEEARPRIDKLFPQGVPLLPSSVIAGLESISVVAEAELPDGHLPEYLFSAMLASYGNVFEDLDADRVRDYLFVFDAARFVCKKLRTRTEVRDICDASGKGVGRLVPGLYFIHKVWECMHAEDTGCFSDYIDRVTESNAGCATWLRKATKYAASAGFVGAAKLDEERSTLAQTGGGWILGGMLPIKRILVYLITRIDTFVSAEVPSSPRSSI